MYSLAKGGALMLGTSLLFLLALPASMAAETRYPNVGRAATPNEVKAWNIDVRGDFAGLPPGQGSVQQGASIWDARCASCHGSFGESNQVFTPIVGGTTAADVESGRVASLIGRGQPQRTTLMKLARLSTLWDYIRRAMPWNAPRSLSPDEVYALTAYILNLGDIVPDDFVLNERNIRDVQQRLPNRNGLTLIHGLGRVDGQPDVHNIACMRDCAVTVQVISSLPEHARDAHGNLADQQRSIGPTRGVATGDAPRKAPASMAANAGLALAEKHGCSACHALDGPRVGPAWRSIAERYAAQGSDPERIRTTLIEKVRSGGDGVWGKMRMPAQTAINQDDLNSIVHWLTSGVVP